MNQNEKIDGSKDKSYSLKVVISAIVTTIIVLMAVLIPLHNIVIEGKDSTIEAFKTTMQSLESKLNDKDEHLIGKDVILDDYRTRLGIIEGNQTSYSILTNKELKDKSLSLVSKIRNMLIRYRVKSDSLTYIPDRINNWNKYTQESMSLSTKMMLSYTHNYKIDAILLRDEILSRLPKNLRSKDNNRDHFDYEHPTNPIGLGYIADHLEKISRLLIE